MFSLSQYDQSCVAQHPEYTRLFQHVDVLNTLAWQQELCHEHLRHFKTNTSSVNFSTLLEYEARIGRLYGAQFDSSIAQADFQSLQQLFAQSKWCRKLDSDIVMTQDMYYVRDQWREGSCRTRIQYYKSKPFEMEHIWKRKLSSVTVESRLPQTSDTTKIDAFAIRIDLNQEIPIVFDPPAGGMTNQLSPNIYLHDTQVVKVEKVRFKWTETYEYQSPDTGLIWNYHFNRTLEGRTKCEAEQKFRQLARFVRYECECECMNFLKVFTPEFSPKMTPIVYLFESLLVKLNDWIKLFIRNKTQESTSQTASTLWFYMYVCVQARLFVTDTEQLYNRFLPFK